MISSFMYCHNCTKNFICKIDTSLDGNHEIRCPHCAHKHFRKVVKGEVTEDRWDSDSDTHEVPSSRIWKAANQPIMTSSATHFIREAFMDRLRK